MIIYFPSKIQCPIKSSPSTSTNHFKYVPCQGLTPIQKYKQYSQPFIVMSNNYLGPSPNTIALSEGIANSKGSTPNLRLHWGGLPRSHLRLNRPVITSIKTPANIAIKAIVGPPRVVPCR